MWNHYQLIKVKISWKMLEIIDPFPPLKLILAADTLSTTYASDYNIIGIVKTLSPYLICTFAPPYIC